MGMLNRYVFISSYSYLILYVYSKQITLFRVLRATITDLWVEQPQTPSVLSKFKLYYEYVPKPKYKKPKANKRKSNR